MSVYNGLVRLKNLMAEGWSMIDVFLKKRHDLIPNLMETVKGYAQHEKSTLEAVMLARSGAMNAKDLDSRMANENALSGALGRLMVVAESYPELKANQNFMQMQQTLSAIEEELATSRRYYNGTVRENNIKIESFPSNIVAGWFHFEKGKFFEVDKVEREAPKVSFN
jgi:LemA protein